MGPDQEVHPFVLEGRQKTFESGEGKLIFPIDPIPSVKDLQKKHNSDTFFIESKKNFVKLCLHSRYTKQKSLHFDEFFRDSVK